MEFGRLAERLSLIVITDPAATRGPLEAALAAIEAGAPAIQLRWKEGTARQILALARELRQATHAAGSLLFINDRLDVALAAGADGAHLGDDDIPLTAARRVAPIPFLIGRSVDTPDEAARAEADGADYLGAGPVFATTSKSDTGPILGLVGLSAIRNAAAIPVVGIGGIAAGRAADVVAAGAAGVAVLGSIMFADDPGAATRTLLEEIARSDRTSSSSPSRR